MKKTVDQEVGDGVNILKLNIRELGSWSNLKKIRKDFLTPNPGHEGMRDQG